MAVVHVFFVCPAVFCALHVYSIGSVKDESVFRDDAEEPMKIRTNSSEERQDIVASEQLVLQLDLSSKGVQSSSTSDRGEGQPEDHRPLELGLGGNPGTGEGDDDLEGAEGDVEQDRLELVKAEALYSEIKN